MLAPNESPMPVVRVSALLSDQCAERSLRPPASRRHLPRHRVGADKSPGAARHTRSACVRWVPYRKREDRAAVTACGSPAGWSTLASVSYAQFPVIHNVPQAAEGVETHESDNSRRDQCLVGQRLSHARPRMAAVHGSLELVDETFLREVAHMIGDRVWH